MDTLGLEIIIQLCRLQVQREREKLFMTPKIRGAAEALRQLQFFAESEGEKLANEIAATSTDMVETFKEAHGTVSGLKADLGEIKKFVADLKGANSAPLGQSSDSVPRSSEVAQR